MDLLQLESVLSSVAPVTPLEALQNLLLALGLGLTVAALHRFSKLETNPSPAMLSAIVLLPPISSLVMMVIGNSLARAFSLVGALAIIRFRTRLRSRWDITFIFLSLSVGVGCGVGAHTVSIVGVVVVGLAVLLLGRCPAPVRRRRPTNCAATSAPISAARRTWSPCWGITSTRSSCSKPGPAVLGRP